MRTPHPRLTRATRRTSTYSGPSGECVQIAELADGVWAVRDSKNPTGPTLIVTPTQWTTFTTGIRNGKFV